MVDGRGSIAFFGTYRPPVPLDIFSLPADSSETSGEQFLTDRQSSDWYNQNAREIPAAALEELLTFLLERNKQNDPAKATDPNKNGLEELLTFLRTRKEGDPAAAKKMKGLIFVSERENGLETLHVALSRDDKPEPTVLSLADIYGADTFGGVRLEDSGCFAGGFEEGGRFADHSLIYVSTKEPVRARRTPWTVVYKTSLADGMTERLTPPDQYDLSPAASPSGKKVAVANFQFNRWNGEIEHLKTDIVVMNVDRQVQGGLRREVLIKNGGWPTWGSDNVIFFHRGYTDPTNRLTVNWRVFRYDIAAGKEEPVTPAGIDAMTPAAISETRVAVATIRKKSNQNVSVAAREEAQYRHIEIFDVTKPEGQRSTGITLKARGKADHFNPFVLDGGSRIGYHRGRTDKLVKLKPLDSRDDTVVAQNKLQKVQMPETHKDVGLFRVSGVFPSFSKDGSKLAFVDNEFQAVWLADENGMRIIQKLGAANKLFSTSWGMMSRKQIGADGEWVETPVETLFVCDGPGFTRGAKVEIKYLEENTSTETPDDWIMHRLTDGGYNNAFPTTSPDGKRMVFRSTRDRSGGDRAHTNLYIMDPRIVESHANNRKALQLTDGPWVDTHCSWAPSGDWIVFASSRDKPRSEPDRDLLDAGFFSIYLINARGILDDPDSLNNNSMPAPVRVIQSSETFRGHVNHPVFSPDMRSLVFTSDLAAVSVEPISMPIFIHSVRPYGDIFAIDLRDKDDIAKNEDIREFHRITHSRYEYSTPAWTELRPVDPHDKWNLPKTIYNALLENYKPMCPYLHAKDQEGWHMAGHLTMVAKCDGADDDGGYQQKPTRYC